MNAKKMVGMVAAILLLTAGFAEAEVGYLDETSIIAWGDNMYGVVSGAPTGSGFKQVSAGGGFGLALTSDGSIVGWGDVPSGTPTGTNFTQVSAGNCCGLALTSDGGIVAWGYDNNGNVLNTPTATGFTQIAAGVGHNLALTSDGSIVAWGDDTYGQVSGAPTGNGFIQVVAGGYSSLALTSDGGIVAWGYVPPEAPPTTTGFTQVTVGDNGNCGLALTPAGGIVAWGDDMSGEVSGAPKNAGFMQVSAGSSHDLALASDGSIAAWGNDWNGDVWNAPATGYYLSVAAGNEYSLALKARQDYEELLVTGTGDKTLLQRDVTVSIAAMIETALVVQNSPQLNVAGTTTVVDGGSLNMDGNWTLQTAALTVQAGGQVTGMRGYTVGTYSTTTIDVAPTGVFDTPLYVESGAQVNVQGSFTKKVSGNADSTIQATGNATLGNVNSYGGFRTDGTLSVGAHTVTLNTKGFATLGALTELSGGTLEAANGFFLGGGRNLVGFGQVDGRVSASFGSVIVADGGNLQLGDASHVTGFFSDGELYTNDNTVALNDANQAVLGSISVLGCDEGEGTLVAPHGMLIEEGKNLIGKGHIQGDVKNQGVCAGDSFMDRLVFDAGYTVKGIGSFSNCTFNGIFSPGNSPIISHVTNGGYGPTATIEIELGGLQPGGEHDQIQFHGEGVMLDGTLDVVLINGFVPSLGDEFAIFVYDFDAGGVGIVGQFASVQLPSLGDGLTWDTSGLYTTGVIGVTPEPITLSLLVLGGLAIVRRRRR